MKRYKQQYVSGAWVVLDCRECRVVDIVHNADTAIAMVESLNTAWLDQCVRQTQITQYETK